MLEVFSKQRLTERMNSIRARLKASSPGKIALLSVVLIAIFMAGVILSPSLSGPAGGGPSLSSGSPGSPPPALGTEGTRQASSTDQSQQSSGVSQAARIYSPDSYTIPDIVEQVSPAVVFIQVQYTQSRSQTESPFGRSYWDYPFPFSGPNQSSGSGFVISDDGYILTNQHLVDQSERVSKILVSVLGTDKPLEAKLVGWDYELDLAVLKIDSRKPLPWVRLGNSDDMRVGEWVIAIGNPYEFDHTVTVGVLSAKGREIDIPDMQRQKSRKYRNLMQTDAAINPGNSGGPLINLRGEVIGINTAVNAAAQGIGFAIPINVAKRVKDELITKGMVVRPWIGIGYRELDETIADYFGLEEKQGVVVVEVYQDSPAARAGFKVGDVIKEVNRVEIKDTEQFRSAIQDMKVGQKLVFMVKRAKRLMVLDVKVGERPKDL
ncbi:MAG: trypsin-like peptidase domain-containing protein [Firmicutes bacterium]|nr:trypsin-like peptidase domain-containing protein [Bacillota bacterium]